MQWQNWNFPSLLKLPLHLSNILVIWLGPFSGGTKKTGYRLKLRKWTVFLTYFTNISGNDETQPMKPFYIRFESRFLFYSGIWTRTGIHQWGIIRVCGICCRWRIGRGFFNEGLKNGRNLLCNVIKLEKFNPCTKFIFIFRFI